MHRGKIASLFMAAVLVITSGIQLPVSAAAVGSDFSAAEEAQQESTEYAAEKDQEEAGGEGTEGTQADSEEDAETVFPAQDVEYDNPDEQVQPDVEAELEEIKGEALFAGDSAAVARQAASEEHKVLELYGKNHFKGQHRMVIDFVDYSLLFVDSMGYSFGSIGGEFYCLYNVGGYLAVEPCGQLFTSGTSSLMGYSDRYIVFCEPHESSGYHYYAYGLNKETYQLEEVADVTGRQAMLDALAEEKQNHGYTEIIVPAPEENDDDTYQLGDNVTAVISGTTMNVSGTGPMYDFNFDTWPDYPDDVTDIVIKDGVTNVGAFSLNCGAESLSIASSITEIGRGAFRLNNFTNVRIPGSVKTIGNCAFADVSTLTSVTLENGIEEIGASAFGGTGLIDVEIPASVKKVGQDAFGYFTDDPYVNYEDGDHTSTTTLESIKFLGDAPEMDRIVCNYAAGYKVTIYYPYGNATWDNLVNSNKNVCGAEYGGDGDTIWEAYGEPEPDLTKDIDGDGLPDYWEENGADVDNDGTIDVPLNEMGADPYVPDLFVEVDWMKGHAPSADAMNLVSAAFARRGVNLHIDYGPDSVDYVTGKQWGNLSEAEELPETEYLDLGYVISDLMDWSDYVYQHFASNRRTTFRYCTYINKLHYNGQDYTYSGKANAIPGMYFVVCDGIVSIQGINSRETTIAEAGTFMHELGHTLGLQHGGNDEIRYKPNYLSVMNYAFQFTGLLTPEGEDNVVDYSEFELPVLNERNLSEEKGIDPNGLIHAAGKQYGTRWYIWQGNNIQRYEEDDVSAKALDYNKDNNYSSIALVTRAEVDKDGNIVVGPQDYDSLYSYNDWERNGTHWKYLQFKNGSIGVTGANGASIISGKISEVAPPDTSIEPEITAEEAIMQGVFIESADDNQSLQYKLHNTQTGEDFVSANRQELADHIKNGWKYEGLVAADHSSEDQLAFKDVSADAFYRSAVIWAVQKGITSGTTETTFSPNEACTRGQMALFLYRYSGSPEVSGTMPFTDVPASSPYYKAILWAVQKEVTAGTTKTTYSPNAPCLRGQMATYLYKLSGSPEVSGTIAFTDVDSSKYYYNAVLWAVQNNITGGTTETTFSPAEKCTRGQMVQFLYKLSQLQQMTKG